MFKRIVFFAFPLVLFSFTALASETYMGQFLYQYKSGNTYRVTVTDRAHMKWECIEGSEKGISGVESPQRFKVNEQVYFATWIEKTGISVSQALDFKHMKVYSTIIDGKERYVLEGKIIREK